MHLNNRRSTDLEFDLLHILLLQVLLVGLRADRGPLPVVRLLVREPHSVGLPRGTDLVLVSALLRTLALVAAPASDGPTTGALEGKLVGHLT